MAEFNRRYSPRQNTEATVQVFLTAGNSTGHQDSGNLTLVTLCNQSENGLYFETDHALQPGSNVSIKMIAPERCRSEDAYGLHDGRVVWCQKIHGGGARFGVGVKILRKVLRAAVLTSRFR